MCFYRGPCNCSEEIKGIDRRTANFTWNFPRYATAPDTGRQFTPSFASSRSLRCVFLLAFDPSQIHTMPDILKVQGCVAVVTGGTGFVGNRLVEMLIEQGAKRVVSLDIVPKPEDTGFVHANADRIEYVVGDIRNKKQVVDACAGADVVFHVAAAVGPYHPDKLYAEVNYGGCLNVIEACHVHKIPRLVMSSSPSTRFDGQDIDGLSVEELPSIPQKSYLQRYAETKALGELAVRAANSPELMTVAVAPHQVREARSQPGKKH